MFDFIDDYPGDNVSYPQNGLYIPDATDCMRCGLCISVCPTYKLFQIEAETPRSRIAHYRQNHQWQHSCFRRRTQAPE